MTELSELPPRERAKRYRVLAFEARSEAGRAKGTARESFLKIAGHWEQLATEADLQADALQAPKEKPPS